jgi:hypothetical protein
VLFSSVTASVMVELHMKYMCLCRAILITDKTNAKDIYVLISNVYVANIIDYLYG